MSEKIKPALTAKEWESRAVARADRNDVEWLHLCAALALDCQPFGFSHQDLRWLRAANTVIATELLAVSSTANVNYDRATELYLSDILDGLKSLADRIAALLPPHQS